MSLNTTEEQIETIELSMEQAKRSIANMDALQRLTKNSDFKKIIGEDYFEKEASRLVLLRAEPAMNDSESLELINNQIIAIGYLRQYFNTIMHFGRMSQRSLENDQETHSELLSDTDSEEGV